MSKISISNDKKHTLLMLHGWGCDKNVFKDYIRDLNNNFNVIAFDLYGFGQSVSPEPFFDTYEYALQVYLYLKDKGIKEISILGHSFGGRLALILSTCFELKVNKLVLTGSAGLKPKRGIVYYYKIYKYKLLKKLCSKSAKLSGSKDYNNANNILKKVLVKVVNQDLTYLLGFVKSNTLLVWGRKDKDTPYYVFKKFKKNIEKVKYYLISNAAHYCLFSHMYLCKNKVREFLLDG